MKTGIHPKFYDDAKIICGCGNTIVVGSTVKEMHTEVCSACHPFYTGKHKLLDTAGRVERFNKKYEKFFTKPKTAEKKPVSKTDSESAE